jgi:mycothiol synthase
LGDARNPVGVIWMIGVAPAYRGQGLGKPILMAGMEYLKSRGVGSITLDVDRGNTLAIKLYTSVGFEKALEVHWFEAELSGG